MSEPEGDKFLSPVEAEVLAVNEAFYRAFAERDLGALDALWARRAAIACVHPGWEPLRGRGEVMASWRAILGGTSVPKIACSSATASVLGDTALVLCMEAIEGEELIATNVFTREDDAWKLVHHHAGPVARRTSRESMPRRPKRGPLN